MKTPKEIVKPFKRIMYENANSIPANTISAAIDTQNVFDAIRQAQDEAWNEALITAVESATVEWTSHEVVGVDKQSILKLLK